MDIKVTVDGVSYRAELYESELGERIAELLPLETLASSWGEEAYAPIPLDYDPLEGQEIVEIGDLAYWPPGRAFCIFYGPTPASTDSRPRAASDVEVFGRLLEDAEGLRGFSGGVIRVEKVEEEV